MERYINNERVTRNRRHDGVTQSKDREGGRAVAIGCGTGEDVLHTLWEPHSHLHIMRVHTRI